MERQKDRFVAVVQSRRGKFAIACIALVVIAFVASFTYWERAVLPLKPEYLAAREFVGTSLSVRQEFGAPIQVARGGQFSYK